MADKRALIFGIGGQDGSYLTELLLSQCYEVHGFHRRTSTGNLRRVQHLLDRVTLHQGDLTDRHSVTRAIIKADAAEVYNLADQDDVGWSYSCSDYAQKVTWHAARDLGWDVWTHTPHSRLYQPLSATMFGTEDGPHRLTGRGPASMEPRSPYACAKVGCWSEMRKLRDVGLHVSCGVLYNHDSERRRPGYLLQTLCRQAVEVSLGERDVVTVGDPEAVVDVGHARDYAEGAWRILQHPEPVDLLLSTWWPGRYPGKSDRPLTVMEWAQLALEAAGVSPDVLGPYAVWKVKIDLNWQQPYPSPRMMYGDSSEARDLVGWDPKTTARDLVGEIVDAVLHGRAL